MGCKMEIIEIIKAVIYGIVEAHIPHLLRILTAGIYRHIANAFPGYGQGLGEGIAHNGTPGGDSAGEFRQVRTYHLSDLR